MPVCRELSCVAYTCFASLHLIITTSIQQATQERMRVTLWADLCSVESPNECGGGVSHIVMHAAAGLDSSNASRVVDILSGLASAGVTVIMTIHQPRPDILRLMDRMLLLSGNGQVGPSSTTMQHALLTQHALTPNC